MNTRLPFLSMNVEYRFEYYGYNGGVSTRRAILKDIYWGTTRGFSEPQWLVRGRDLDAHEERVYALNNICPVPNEIQQADPKLKADPAEYLAKGEYFTMLIQRDPASARPDLPRHFTWMPTRDQRARALVNHDGQSLEKLCSRGGVTWAELAAILRNVPYSWIAEQRAVAACTTLYPQEGFVL